MARLTKGEQFVYDWQYGRHESTSFKGYLAKAISVADNGNRDRLRLAFPDEVKAMNLFSTQWGWWAGVEDAGNKDRLVIVGDHPAQLNKATTEEK